MTDVSRVDLNLLISLEALLEEKSVSRAARRLSLGQPAMSYNLARLRRLFGDELLVRGPGGMVPTSRAAELEADLREVLRRIRTLVDARTRFDPATAEITFRMGVGDGVETLLVPTVSAMLAASAPRLELRLVPIGRGDVSDDLDRGSVDLAVGTFSEGRSSHKRRVIYSEDRRAIFNPRLIAIGERLELSDYVRNPLLVVDGADADPVPAALERLNLRPRIAVRTPHLSTAPLIVSGAPLVATVHTRVALFFADRFGLAVRSVPPELDLPPSKLVLMWHPASDDAPAHRFMRNLVASALESLKREEPRGRSASNRP